MHEAAIALIPARAGSKGIPGKNLRRVGGISLLGRAIETCRRARSIRRVIVSTDSPAIAEAARDFGAETPFLRPSDLAQDDTPMHPVLRHAIFSLAASGDTPAVIALVQPTSPFLLPETIDRAIAALTASGFDHLKAVRRVREHPAWMLAPDGDALVPYLRVLAEAAEERDDSGGVGLRRQELPTLFIPCGALYLYRVAAYTGREPPRRSAPCAWVEVGWPESIDIDDEEDLLLAEWVAKRSDAAVAVATTTISIGSGKEAPR